MNRNEPCSMLHNPSTNNNSRVEVNEVLSDIIWQALAGDFVMSNYFFANKAVVIIYAVSVDKLHRQVLNK